MEITSQTTDMKWGVFNPSTFVLPLQSGDRLTRREFEHRYQAMTHVKKAELIEGVVYMASPVHLKSHGTPHAAIMTWLGTYWAATAGVALADNATVRLDVDNEVQPDALLRLDENLGGHSRVSEDDYLEGPPELIVEIAASSASYDLHDKRKVYRRNGIQEYLVWQVYEKQLNWFSLVNDEYVFVAPNDDGIIASQVFPGLHLDVKALLDGNLAAVLAALQKGLTSSEYMAFVERLSGGVI